MIMNYVANLPARASRHSLRDDQVDADDDAADADVGAADGTMNSSAAVHDYSSYAASSVAKTRSR